MNTREKIAIFQKQFNPLFEKEVANIISEQFSFHQATTELDKSLLDIVRQYSHGGKRIRPFLIDFFSGPKADTKLVMDVAIASELFHLAALIHDDIMDDSVSRRGADTIHIAAQKLSKENNRLGKDVALLLGDMFLTSSLAKAADLPKPLFKEFKTMIQRTIRGQYLDSFGMNQPFGLVSRASLTARYELKTARYTFTSPAIFGCMLNNTYSEESLETLTSVMNNLGLLFQIRDDIIDCIDEHSGKPLFGDIFENQTTWATLYIKENYAEEFRKLIKAKEAQDIDTIKLLFKNIDLATPYNTEYEKLLNSIKNINSKHLDIKNKALDILELLSLT